MNPIMSAQPEQNPYEQPVTKENPSGELPLDAETETSENQKFTSQLIYCAAAFCAVCVAYFLWRASVAFRLLELTRTFGMLQILAIINILFGIGFATAGYHLWKYGTALLGNANETVSDLIVSQRQAYSWLSILLVAILFAAKFVFEELQVAGLF